MKKSLPQLKRVRITLHLKFCALLIQQNIPPNYLKKQILKMGSKETTSMFQQGRGMNWTVKKTTLIISKKEKNNLLKTILFCQHIKSSLNKKDKKQRKHIIIIPVLSYTHVLKHLWWSLIYIRFYNFQTIILTYYYYYTKKKTTYIIVTTKY